MLPSLAHAHASLVASDPAAEAVLAAAPATITLTFNEPVTPLALQLIDARGRSSAITEVATNGDRLSFAPPSLLGAGGHVLSWRVVSADGHPVGGSLTFWIGTPGASLPAIIVPDDPARRAAIWATRVMLELTLLAAPGGAFFLAWIASAALPVLVAGCGAVAVLGLGALALSVGLQGLDILDAPFAELGSAAVWWEGATGSFGRSAAIAAVAFGLTLSALLGRGAPARLLSFGAVLGVGAALAASGHAATAEPRWLATAAVLVHGVSLALWVGALLPLAVMVGPNHATANVTLRRFSRTIPIAIATLLISGVVLGAIQLGRIEALWTSDYGRILFAKLALVVALLLIALWNRRRVTPLLAAGTPHAAYALRRTIAAELVLVIAILGLVGLWRFTPPPRAATAAAAEDRAFAHLHTGRAMANVTLTPGHAGPIEIEVMLQTPDETPLQAQALTVTLANPDAGIEPASAEARRQPDGPWRVRMSAPVPGRWSLTLGILISDFDKVTIAAPVVIR
ncbi:Copper resistance protein [Rhodopseudomonas palustris HaA2]|uniref:Copper resistance protein n=2 Tax=Rhodopseudomonas palustris TaxID=1076 RepID=Q2IWW1_RHOP2|nr:Copper resistance protein [Rhodopseudomonas palustris HaA2]